MVVVGKHAAIIAETGKTADVRPFSPNYDSLEEVKIVDAAIKWTCPYNDIDYILVFKNALYVPSMENNLVPPFIMREAGIEVCDTPKIHVNEPEVSDHSIYFKEEDVRIPLALHGIFSYFLSSTPTSDELKSNDNVLYMTPEGFWDPHQDEYALNEENMVDHEGNVLQKE